jgi:Protein of unknown function (DUF3040)
VVGLPDEYAHVHSGLEARAMISDSERRSLAEIETALQAEDPAFARRFSASPRRRTLHRVVMVLTLVAAVVFTTVALVQGSVIATAFGMTVIGAIAGVWVSRRTGSGHATHG